MSSSQTNKTLCAVCNKAIGNFTCRGCKEHFCSKHVTSHREQLGKTMEDIIFQRNELRQTITEYTGNIDSHPLVKQVKQWEKDAINKIHEIAEQCRNQLSNIWNQSSIEITNNLDELTTEIENFQTDDTFVETDLETLKVKLEKLKEDIMTPKKVTIETNFNDVLYSMKILVLERANDIFETSFGNVTINDSGTYLTHGLVATYGCARGREEYSSGCYQLRFKIVSVNDIGEIFFGIVSKNALMQSNSLTVPSSYGWMGNYTVIENGVKNTMEQNERQSLFRKNDVGQLIINCNRKCIYLINERIPKELHLQVDENKCSFPWKLNICLGYWSDSVRLLST